MEDLGASILAATLDIDVYGFPPYDVSKRLGDVLAVLETGSRPKGGVIVSNVGVVSLGAESVQSAGIMTTTEFKRVSHSFAAEMRRGRLADGDILVYKDGGSPGNFTPHISAFGQGFPVDEATINEHVYRARAGQGFSQGLLYWMLRSPWMDQEMRKRGTGVAIPGLNSTNFKDLPLPAMDAGVVTALNEQLDPMLAAMLRFGAECRRLTALRDTLLAELLSGRIRIPEAVEAAVR
jgi:type I restriction enzyme S subunit